MQVKVLKDKVTISAFVFSPWAYTYSSASPRPSVGNGVNGTAIIRNVTHSPDFFYGTDWALLQHRWCLTSVGPLNDPGIFHSSIRRSRIRHGKQRFSRFKSTGWCQIGFLVPFTAFGNASNQAGISTSEWQKCQALYVNDPNGCSSAPRGACTQVSTQTVDNISSKEVWYCSWWLIWCLCGRLLEGQHWISFRPSGRPSRPS